MARKDTYRDPDELIRLFMEFGGVTDEKYLRVCWTRFVATHAFVGAVLKANSTILDVGAHWLHQTAFFWRDGHKIIAADVPNSTDHPAVKRAAEAMGIELVRCERLDRGDGIALLPENSVDAILFCEIIEHITFNPVDMWKALYRVLRPGGRIFVTTPNSLHFERVYQKLSAMFDRGEYGLDVDELFAFGTYGHHWKEYSIPELLRYFATLSPDFLVTRAEASTPYQTPEVVACAYEQFLAKPPIGGLIPLQPIVESLDRIGAQPLYQQLFIEVTVPEKRNGVVVSAPW